MSGNRQGKQTILLNASPTIRAGAAVVGPREGKGPLGQEFDEVTADTLVGEQSWERAEARMLLMACKLAAEKGGKSISSVDCLLSGDLLNQVIASNFSARDMSVPFLGLFGACSTMVEAMSLGGMMVDGEYASSVICGTSSHHDTAERQFRFPTEFANQRGPAAQWTVTGAGAVLLDNSAGAVRMTACTIGKVVDMGMGDPNNLGSAMAAAAAETIFAHFQDTGQSAHAYDAVVTGDLGVVGREVLIDLLLRSNIAVEPKLFDCGLMMYDGTQDVHAGGSGCGCLASVFSAHWLPLLSSGDIGRILLIGTGALFSPTSYQQGETIPCIAHSVSVQGPGR